MICAIPAHHTGAFEWKSTRFCKVTYDFECLSRWAKCNSIQAMLQIKYNFDSWLNQAKPEYAFDHLQISFGKIRYIDTGNKTKPCLLMVPDGPCVLEHFYPLIEVLKNDFRVIVFDMPGFGFSYPENGYNHSLQSGSDVIAEVLNSLQISKATLAFSCANGFYAVVFATQHPHMIDRLVIMQTPSYSEMEKWVQRQIPFILKLSFVGQLFCLFFKKNMPAPWFKVAVSKKQDLKNWIDISVKNFDQGGCNCLASVVQGLSESDQKLPIKVTCPTTMIWGKQDKSHRPTNPQSFQTLVPHASIEIWEDVGHFANLEDPIRFRDLLLKK